MTTAILGGGLSGLALARLLHEKGKDVIVLEAEPAYGGLCRSKTEQGFTFDIGGSHIIFSRDTEVLGFMRRMIAGNEQRNDRNTKIFYKDHYVKYPFENGLSDLTIEDRFFCINEFVKTHVAVEKCELPVPENFREWIYYTFGKGIAECYMVPYNEKIWKFPTDQMSLHWVDGRIPRPPVEDVIKSAIGIPTEGYTHQSVFSYPLDGGIEALVKAVAQPIREKIRTGFRVTSVRKKDGRFEISNGSETIVADRCISTMPVQHLVAALEGVPLRVKEACAALRYNAIVCVNIGIRGTVPDISWLYIPEIALGMTNRISFPSNYSARAVPEGCGSVLAEITHQPGDEVSRMDDGTLVAHVVQTLEAMQILTKDRVVYSSVERQPYAYVVYDLNYQKNIAIVKEYCTSVDIPLVGRFSQFEYLNMDGCLRSVMDFSAQQPES
ncbi:MAG: FAD-dependent oxidoreductase [Methanomicrobiales archaeon HGW-Methanomicrobiales-1]|nr:MAG: FAD-dependent oxidoreductase [Methanomicrobiales archaeon HGW-Methanomicrobiales-1]